MIKVLQDDTCINQVCQWKPCFEASISSVNVELIFVPFDSIASSAFLILYVPLVIGSETVFILVRISNLPREEDPVFFELLSQSVRELPFVQISSHFLV